MYILRIFWREKEYGPSPSHYNQGHPRPNGRYQEMTIQQCIATNKHLMCGYKLLLLTTKLIIFLFTFIKILNSLFLLFLRRPENERPENELKNVSCLNAKLTLFRMRN